MYVSIEHQCIEPVRSPRDNCVTYSLPFSAEFNGGFARSELRDEEAHEVVRKRVLAQMIDLLPNRSIETVSARALWPGGLNQAIAYLSATQQQVAQSHQWPVDTLRLTLEIGNNKVTNTSIKPHMCETHTPSTTERQ